ncbi:MAG: C-type lectin domain-containing protein, partial [Lachnospiraceae bacterium]|nr:C-type lectin domain-containing protein [Lachnospiraceae bacterium]
YDEAGNQKEYIDYDSYGNQEYRWEGEYDKAGNQISQVSYDENGKITYSWECKYDEQGRQIEYTYYDSYTGINGKSEYEYDEMGNQTKGTETEDGVIIYQWERTFDILGNITSDGEYGDETYEYQYAYIGEKETVVAEEVPEAEEVTEAEEEPFYYDTDESGIHTYELIVDDVTWTEAYLACLARGGHLVRINSEEEYQAIVQQIGEEEKGKIMFWLGGTRSAADVYEYRWIYEDGTYGSEILNEDEPYSYYWLDGEPSFYDESILQDEMYMNMFYVGKEQRWVWNDVPEDLIEVAEFYSGMIGYICEYEE